VDDQTFYRNFFARLEPSLGKIDHNTLVAIVGFDAGGPLNFCTSRGAGDLFPTYISCELAVRKEQQPSEFGRYELVASCDNEWWVRSIVSDVGRMTLETTFGDGHTLDIGPWVKPSDPIQGVVFEKACECRVGRCSFGALRVIGVSRRELEYAQSEGVRSLIARLKMAGIYPNTLIKRSSII
jgi:hypothetical protein